MVQREHTIIDTNILRSRYPAEILRMEQDITVLIFKQTKVIKLSYFESWNNITFFFKLYLNFNISHIIFNLSFPPLFCPHLPQPQLSPKPSPFIGNFLDKDLWIPLLPPPPH